MNRSKIRQATTLTMVLALLMSLGLQHTSQASTQAGELVVVEGKGKKIVSRIMFMEYFSGPREFYIGQTWKSDGMKGGWLANGTAVTYIDGRYVTHEAFIKAMVPGRRYYQYGSRHTKEFMHAYTYDLPTQGHFLKAESDQVTLRRFMLRRADTGSAVFRNFQVSLDKNAQYMIDARPASQSAVFKKSELNKRLIRVFPARAQTLSVFQPESLATYNDFGETHKGGRTGFILKQQQVDHKGKSMSGVLLKVNEGGEWIDHPMAIDRKGYIVLDGRYVPWRNQALEIGHTGTAGVYRKWTKAKYFMVRSKTVGAWDGVITKVEKDSIKVKMDISGEERTVKIDSDARILLDGMNTQASQALKAGYPITVFPKRPQVVEALTGCPRQPEHPQMKTETKGKTIPFAIIEYRADRHRRVVSDGYYPLIDRDKEPWEHIKNNEAGVRFPKRLVEVGPDGLRAVTPEEGPFYWTIPQLPPRP